MNADRPRREPRDPRPSSWRAHALGLVGANLAIGALFVWALPALVAFWHPAGGDEGSLVRLLSPWNGGDGGVGVAAVLFGVLILAVFAFGLALMARAARMLGDRE